MCFLRKELCSFACCWIVKNSVEQMIRNSALTAPIATIFNSYSPVLRTVEFCFAADFYGRSAQQMRTLYCCPVVFFSFFLCLFSAIADWMPLGTEVGLGPGHIVLDGDPAPPKKGAQPPQFSGHVYCGQMVAHLCYC